MIVLYDDKENLIGVFDNYKEVAKYFETSETCMRSRVCRAKKNGECKIHFKNKKGWYKIIRIKKGDDEDEF